MDKPTIVFFGNERLATGVTTDAPTLRALIAEGYRVAAVISNFERSKSRNARELEIATVAREHNIPLLLPTKPSEIIEQLRGYSAVVGVLVAYGKIVPTSVIDIFPRGIVNIHPSLLPLHRGPTPIESVILNGEAETGVSIMQLVKAMDAGPVYAQERFQVPVDISKAELASSLLAVGKDMLLQRLPAIIDGSLQPTPQDDSAATYDALLQPEQSQLNFNTPAQQLEREIRAFAEWPKSRAVIAQREVIITKAHAQTGSVSNVIGQAVATAQRDIAIQTTDGILVVEELKPAGKTAMPASAFLAGNRL